MSVEDVARPPTTPTPTAGEPSGGELSGHLNTLSLIAAVVAFNGPLAILAGFIPIVISGGNGLSAPLTFLSIALAVLIFAVGLNAMAARMINPGAFYTYITAGLGRLPGLAAGLIAVLTYLALGAGTYALVAVMANHLLETLFQTQPISWWLWALIGWAVCTGLSLFNIDVSAKVLGFFMVCEIVVIMIYNAFVLIDGGPEGRSVDIVSGFFSGNFPLAMLFGTLCLTGFESIQVFRSETKDPEKTVPRATYLSIILIGCLHAFAAFCYIVAYGPGQALVAGATDPTGSVLDSIRLYVSGFAADAANVLLMTCLVAAGLAIQNISARYFFMFARDGLLPARIGKVNLKHGSPMNAGMFSGALMLIIFSGFAIGGLDAQVAYPILTGLGAFWVIMLWVATSLAVMVFFIRRQHAERVPLWQSMIAPAISVVVFGYILILATIYLADIIGGYEAVATGGLILTGLALAGGIGAGLWLRKHNPAIYRRIGNQSESIDL